MSAPMLNRGLRSQRNVIHHLQCSITQQDCAHTKKQDVFAERVCVLSLQKSLTLLIASGLYPNTFLSASLRSGTLIEVTGHLACCSTYSNAHV